MCIRTTPAWEPATTSASSGSVEAPDIVDDPPAGLERLAGDLGLDRVDRDRHREPAGDRLHDRDHPTPVPPRPGRSPPRDG